MAKFKVIKRIDLAFVGEEWKECYLDFNVPSYRDIQSLGSLKEGDTVKASKKAIEVLEKHFVDGEGIGEDGEKIKIKKEDLQDLPFVILVKAMTQLGEVPPNE